jgi:hypothetical protein
VLGALSLAGAGLVFFYLLAVACCGVVRSVLEMPGVPDDAAGLRSANARLRELMAERDAEIATPLPLPLPPGSP